MLLEPGASLVAQVVNNPCGRHGFEPLEEEMAIHSGILAWRIPWVEESGGLHSMGSQS